MGLTQRIHQLLVNHTPLPICHGWSGPCFRAGRRRRQNTAYANEKRNWVFLCDKCMAECNDFYMDYM